MCNLSPMSDQTDLYATILGVGAPWYVTDVAVRASVGHSSA